MKSQRTYRALRLKVIQALGGKCSKCGFPDHRTFQIDHIHGGGSRETRTGRDRLQWPEFYRRVLEKLETEYQLLCANCNAIKKYEQRENPPGRPKGIPLRAKYKAA